MKYVVSVGGGLSSTLALPMRILAEHGRENVDFVMCKLPNEDSDVWRLVDAVERTLDISITMIGQLKTPWDIFFELGYINPVNGHGRADPCSKILKRECFAEYIQQHYDQRDTTICLGITAHEYSDRWFHIHKNWTKRGWIVEAPLAHDKSITREAMMDDCHHRFGFVPRLYRYGFDHNNCGGACIKAGQAQWARLLYYLPDVYGWWEDNEERFRSEINGEIAILRRTRRGITSPLPLSEFRAELEERWHGRLPDIDPFENLESTAPCVYCESA
jgi:hypothetical protein